MTTTILAIDLGKFKSVARARTAPSFLAIASTRTELTALISYHAQAIAAIEACTLAGWVSDLSAEREVACEVAGTSSEDW